MQTQTRTTTKKKGKPLPKAAGPATSGTKKAAAKRPRSQKKVKALITPEERHRLIAETAYFYAETRSFAGGDPVQDWLQAEAQVDSIYVVEH